ncbi:hypothetical protein [Nocardia tengchongensis]|uniref:hypothetical protein n=1 Tax=Nocardia tengchongensis TaxID=2055889 RepID=UPI00364E8923
MSEPVTEIPGVDDRIDLANPGGIIEVHLPVEHDTWRLCAWAPAKEPAQALVEWAQTGLSQPPAHMTNTLVRLTRLTVAGVAEEATGFISKTGMVFPGMLFRDTRESNTRVLWVTAIGEPQTRALGKTGCEISVLKVRNRHEGKLTLMSKTGKPIDATTLTGRAYRPLTTAEFKEWEIQPGEFDIAEYLATKAQQ